MDPSLIRNFAIIAHIDHGKSTLADRLLELTGSLTAREMQAQVLDAMDLERERGITIKAHSVRMMYPAEDGNDLSAQPHRHTRPRGFQLRSFALAGIMRRRAAGGRCVPGRRSADSGQCLHRDQQRAGDHSGHQQNRSAQRRHRAHEGDDREAPSASMHRIRSAISAKTGQGVPDVLEAIVKHVPPPKGRASNQLQALIFDSWFDSYRGVIVLARVIQGVLSKGQRIRADVEWPDLRCGDARGADAETGGSGVLKRRRSRLPDRQHQERSPTPRSATPSPTTIIRPLSRCPASKN